MPSTHTAFTASPASSLSSKFISACFESMSSIASPAGASSSKEEKLLALMDRSGYSIVQENGQRKYGPPPNWTGPYPPKGCEVFVGKLPRDLYEDELVPIFEEVGMIFELRLMMDFSGSNRGFAFVTYTNPEDAKRAIKIMNNFEIRKGRVIGVCKSVDNCRLFVGGIPKIKTKEEIQVEMEKVTEGVVDVILYSSVHDKTKNRGFAFVEYESHRSAAMARRKLIPGKIQLWGHEIAVDWAEPEPEVDEDTMSKVTILYVRNLMPETSEDQIRTTFTMRGVLKVDKVKKLRDFAFVHYALRQDAETAVQELNGIELDGSILEVTWAKPADKVNRRGAPRGSPLPIVATYPAGPVVYSHAGYDVMYGPSYGYPANPLQPANGHPSSSYLVPRVAIRGRSGRGAAGMRGLRGGISTRTASGLRRPAEVLQDICQKNNWGEPIYTLHTTVHPETGDNVQLYLYKIHIPGMPTQYNHFQPPKVCQYMEEAKQYAAQFALTQLGITVDDGTGGSVVSGAMPGAGTAGLGPTGGPYNRVGFIGPPPAAAAYETGYYEPLHVPIY